MMPTWEAKLQRQGREVSDVGTVSDGRLPTPDPELSCLGDQFIPEVRVGDRDQGLGTLPAGHALEIDHPVLGDQVVDGRAGACDHGARRRDRLDPGMHLALFVRVGGRQADEALASLGPIGGEHEVELTAGAADVTRAGRFGTDLTCQVDFESAVDGDDLVILGGDAGSVRVVHGVGSQGRVVVHEVVQLLGTRSKGPGDPASVDGLAHSGDSACLDHVAHGIDQHLRVDTEVLEVGFRDHLPESVRHSADPQLDAGPVRDLGQDVLGDPPVRLRRRYRRQFRKSEVTSFDDVVDLRDMHGMIVATVDLRHVFVDLDNDRTCHLTCGRVVRDSDPEAEVPMLVHRCDLDGHDICTLVLTHITRHLRVLHGKEVGDALLHHLPLEAPSVPAVPGEMLTLRVTLEAGHRLHEDGAAEIVSVQPPWPLGEQGPSWVRRTRALWNAPKRRRYSTATGRPVSYTHLRAHETRHDLVC